MNEKIIFATFLTVFLGLLSAVHYYVFAKFSNAFGIDRGIIYYVVMIFFVISYLIANLLMVAKDTVSRRLLYFGTSSWLGLVFFLFCYFLLSDIISIFVTLDAVMAALLVILVSFILLIYSIINASSLSVKNIKLTSSKIKDTLKIVQFSDLHLGAVFDMEYLSGIVDRVNALNPDIVLITGDLFDGPYHYDAEHLKILNNIIAPIYFSTGNHEGYAGMQKVHDALKNVDIKLLRNESFAIDVNGDKIELIGVDDAESKSQIKDVLSTLTLNPKLYKILMYHRPDGYKDAIGKVDLMLAGHTHDGQIWPLTYLVPIFSYPVTGLRTIKDFTLYISTGAGGWGPPLRLGSKNEIVHITINPRINPAKF